MQRAKWWLVIAIVMTLVAVAYAQLSNGAFFSWSSNPGGTCPAPVAGTNTLCFLTSDVQFTVNGAAYQTMRGKDGLAGAQGPQGPAGPQGLQGPPGAVGPPGATSYSQLTNKPTTISCSQSSQSNAGFTASGCTIQ